MNSEIDECISLIKQMIVEDEFVTINYEKYIDFKDKITGFVYKTGLDETKEWLSISRFMIYKSTEYLSLSEANQILINLESLKRKCLKNEYEMIEFDKHVHPIISSVSKTKFFDCHYADAVESAFKEINTQCKKIYKNKTGEEKDGADLMNRLFSANDPLLVFEDMDTNSGKDVQIGYMHIFAGAMTGIRNPKAHENQTLDKEGAYKRLILASLLMDKIEEALKKQMEVE